MTRIEILDFSMKKVEKIQEKLLDLHDYLEDQKFIALVRRVTILRKEIGLLKRELETYRK